MRIVSIFALLEKDRLRSSVFGLPKVAETNANEPIALLRTEIDPLSQFQGNASQFFAGRGCAVWRMATSNDLELACLQLEDNRTCHPWFIARCRPKLFCETPDHWLSFCQQNVTLECIFDGYRFRPSIRNDFGIVDTAGKLVEALTTAAEVLFENGQGESS